MTAAGGHEVKHLGDGMMAVFSSPVDAVNCAVAIEHAADSHADAAQRLDVRIGLNAGEVTTEGDDYFGSAVNVAAQMITAKTG